MDSCDVVIEYLMNGRPRSFNARVQAASALPFVEDMSNVRCVV